MKRGWAVVVLFCLLAGCSKPVPQDALVLTQTPGGSSSTSARNALDLLFPCGSRVVHVGNGSSSNKTERVLSTGLIAAGEPVVSWDGKRVVFAGKVGPDAEWQIYETPITGGSIKRLTGAKGGAMDPALLGDGTLLYISPVPTTNCLGSTPLSALYILPRDGGPRQLTFSGRSVSSPTVLSDGRILFVSTQPAAGSNNPGQALYTINNDGTEVTAYAGQHDKPTAIRRPRQLSDGRVVFLSNAHFDTRLTQAECVASARPFNSRELLFPKLTGNVWSVEPATNGELLLCADPSSNACCRCSALFRIGSLGNFATSPILADSQWNTIEAVPAGARARPMGRLSSVDSSRRTGQILCLNTDYTTYEQPGKPRNRAAKIRVFTLKETGKDAPLGEVAVQTDGSFMAEVPADMPLGFEAVDAAGTVLRREEALVWVRPGENRSCQGCHEPHNHAPPNARPLAVREPVPKVLGHELKLAGKSD